MGIIGQLKYYLFNKKWRKLNKHNGTYIAGMFNPNYVQIGIGTYGPLKVCSNTDNILKIGNYCSIAENVTFMLGLDHPTNHISTFPYKVKCLGHTVESISKGDIVVDDDVWIGYGATILSGVHIGQGAVIAAGAVVSKDVSPYSIVGGVPAKIIKYRFDDELIQELMKIDYSKLSKDVIQEHIDELYKELTDIKQLEWLPRK